jgi:hypothetical protein
MTFGVIKQMYYVWKLIKKYAKFLNRLDDITWFGTIYP